MSVVWKNILVAVFSFLLAIVGQQYYFEKQNEIQRIDVHTSFDSDYISKPKFPDSKVEITVDGNTKDSIGLLEVSLVNFSSKVFTDVPLLIEIRPKKTGTFNYLSHFAHGEKGMKDLVVKTKDYEYDNGVHRFSYKVKSLNRSEEADISMKLGVLFEGEKEPDVLVSAVGLSTREFNIENSPSRAKVKRDAFLLVIGLFLGLFLVTFIMVGPLISRLTSPLDRKSNKRYAKELFDVLRAEPLHQSMTDGDLKGHIATILYKRQIIWWSSKSWLGKWSLGMREPQPSDYQI
ncbi:MAG: hypothetical protein KUG81_09415 [Gammaproteobacteria bacterium]|nr:hypothetical protein [Gammaproteobacteria bacterium]